MMSNQCKTCKHFERSVWAKELNGGVEEPQCGGNCDILLNVLKIDGNIHYSKNRLYIQDRFGCVFHSDNEPMIVDESTGEQNEVDGIL